MKFIIIFSLIVSVNLMAKEKAIPNSQKITSALVKVVGKEVPAIQKTELNFEPSKGTTNFTAVGKPDNIKIDGKGTGPKGQLFIEGKNLTGEFKVDLKSLDTGMDMRNEHMQENYLHVEKFPEAVLVISKLSLQDQDLLKDVIMKDLDFEGTLKLHGKESPIKGKTSLARKGNEITVDASFSTQVTAYGIDVPSFAGITVANDVSISVNTKAQYPQ